MQYPTILAGQRITAGLLRSMTPQYVYKQADTTRTSTTTFTDDPDLQFTLEANATYYIEFLIRYASVAAAGFKTAWNVSAGGSGLKTVWGPDTSPTNVNNPTGDGRWGVHGFTTSCSYGTRDGANQVMAWETADIATTSATTVAIQWAQTTSNAGATRVAFRSFGRCTRIA